jgi:hypothetical protein
VAGGTWCIARHDIAGSRILPLMFSEGTRFAEKLNFDYVATGYALGILRFGSSAAALNFDHFGSKREITLVLLQPLPRPFEPAGVCDRISAEN